MRKRLFSYAINLTLIAISVCFTLLLVEGAMRFLGLSYREIVLSRGMMLDPVCGFRLRPNSRLPGVPHIFPEVQINSLGMRDREYSEEKPEGTLRILALGDSFAYGRVDNKYNFLTLLEEKLNGERDRPLVEILNTGVPAYQPVNELAYLKEYGFTFDPDFVLLFLYVGNDLRNNDLPATEIEPASEIHVDEQTYQNLWGYRWLSGSELYWVLVHIHLQRQLRSEIMSRVPVQSEELNLMPDEIHPEFSLMSIEEYDRTLQTQLRNYLKPQFRNDWDRKNMASTVQILTEARNACTANEIGFAVVLIPAEPQVNSEVQERFLQLAAPLITRPEYDFAEPQKTLTTLLNEQGISTIDLLPHFTERAKEKNLYLLRDTHWNEAGNHLAAETIFPIIEDWVKSSP